MGLEEDIAASLATQGIGTVGTDIFTGTLPSSPQNCVAVIPTGGIRLREDLNAIKRPSFQVVARNARWNLGMDKAELIFTALDRKWNLMPSAKGQIVADHEPGVFFRDNNNLQVFSLNFSTILQR